MPEPEFSPSENEIRIYFSSCNPINTIDLLLRKSGLSLRTLRRRMKVCGLISSYNANSSFYTLPALVDFDSQGLWHYQSASFSIWGSLHATIKNLVNNSSAGYTAAELSAILYVKTDDFLRILSKKRKVDKVRPVFRNIYVSIDNKISRKQIQNRKRLSPETAPAKPKLPGNTEQIMILTEIILTEKLTVDAEEICRRINKKGHTLNSEQIDNVINYYGLKKIAYRKPECTCRQHQKGVSGNHRLSKTADHGNVGHTILQWIIEKSRT